jgi:HlyD family type I secretion membrane fusion protein
MINKNIKIINYREIMSQDQDIKSKQVITQDVKSDDNIIKDSEPKIRAFVSKISTNKKFVDFLTKLIVTVDYSIDYIVEPKSTKYERDPIIQVSRAPINFGVWILVFMFGFFGVWATFFHLDTASHCPGTVVVSSNRQVIQHLEGGIVKEVYVKNGDLVTAGQKLLLLSSSRAETSSDTNKLLYYSFLANESRLNAERNLADKVEFPQELIDKSIDPKVNEIYQNQLKLFNSSMSTYNNKIESYKKKLEQSKKATQSFVAKELAAKKQYEIFKQRVDSAKTLVEKGHASKIYLLEQESRLAEAQGQLGDFKNKVLESEQAVTAVEFEIESFKSDFLQNISKELKDTQNQLNEITNRMAQSTDEKNRLLITSPVDGVVHNFTYMSQTGQIQHFAPGSVITQSAHIMDIVPNHADLSDLVVEAKISAKDRDAVAVGQRAKMQITAFKSRNTPNIMGEVIYISSDVLQDGRTNEPPYYSARVMINKEEYLKDKRLKKLNIKPGMAVDVAIISGSKTFLRYLLDPITDSFALSFSER